MQVNLKKNLLVVNPALEAIDSKDTILSIRLSLDGFYFSVVNKPTNELLLLADYSANFNDSFSDNLSLIRPIFEEHKLTTRFFPNKKVIIKNNRFTLLPKNLFDKNNIITSLNLLHDNSDIKTTEFADQLADVYTVYDFPFSLIQATRLIFPTAEYTHQASALLNFSQQFVAQNQTTAVLDVDDNNFYLAIFNSEKLLFCNSFEYQSKENFIYFLLAVFSQLNIDNHTVKLFATGKIAEESQLYSMLFKYIKDINIVTNPICKTNLNVNVNHYSTFLFTTEKNK